MAETARLNLIVDASGAERSLTSFEAKAKSVGAKARGAFDNLKDSVFSLKGAFAGLVGAIGVRSVFNTIASFEKMEASLRTVTGSTEAAANAMNVLQNFASETPFQITELTDAFIKLQALGLSPSEDALRSYGNTASALGKDLNQMIEAVADASTGEFERLKEFGIKAKSQGDQVSFTFQGVTKTVGKNAQEIQDYLLAIGDTQFAGAMEAQMDTLSGRLSNFQDQLTTTLVRLGKAGLTQVFKNLLDGAIAAITFIGEKVALLPLYFKSAFAAIDKMIINIRMGFAVLGESIVFSWDKALATAKDTAGSFLRDISGVMARIPGFGDQAAQINDYATSLENAATQVGTLEERLIPVIQQYTRQKQVIDDVMDAEFRLQAEREAIAAKATLPTITPPKPEGQAGPDAMDRLLDQAAAQEEELKRQSEFNAEKLAVEQAYWDQLYNLETGSQKAIFDFTEALRTRDLQGALKNGAAALANAARTSKTAFEIQKRLALANAAVTLPSAVIKSYENGGGYPFGIIPAGLMLAAGLQQINAIKSSSFQGGGGMPPSPGAAGSGSAVGTAAGLPPGAATPAAAAVPPAPPKQDIRVSVQGGLYSDQDVRNLLDRINEVSEDTGGNMRMVPA